MKCIKLSFFSAFVVIAFPILLLLLPIFVALALLKVFYNLCRGARWRIVPLLKLSFAVVQHICYVLKHVPLMLHVMHFYVFRAALRDGVKINIPYEEQVVVFEDERRKRGGGSAGRVSSSSPVSSCSSTASSSSNNGTPIQEAKQQQQQQGTLGSGDNCASALPPVLRLPPPSVAVPPSLSQRSLCCLDVYPPLAGAVRQPSASTSDTTTGSSSSAKKAGRNLLAPVLVFVYGGAWGSGNKWMYARFAAMLRDACGAVVVVPNYPTYPDGTMLDMVESLHRCVMWVRRHIAHYGGDKEQIWLVGHSAGAHLVALLAVRRGLAVAQGSAQLRHPDARVRGDGSGPVHPLAMWGDDTLRTPLRCPCHDTLVDFTETPPIAGVVALAGAFDLRAHLAWEEMRCVADVSTMRPATGGYWDAHSPGWLLQHEKISATSSTGNADESVGDDAATSSAAAAALLVQALPRHGFHFFHDPTDATVPIEQSRVMRDALLAAGVPPSLAPPVVPTAFGHSEVVMGPLKANPRLGIHLTIKAVLSVISAASSSLS